MVTWYDINGVESPFNGLTPAKINALGSEAIFFTEFEIANWPPKSFTPRQLAGLQRPGPTPELTRKNRERGPGNALPSLHGDWFNRIVILERAIEAALKNGHIDGYNGRITVQSFVAWLVHLGERPSLGIQTLFDDAVCVPVAHVLKPPDAMSRDTLTAKEMPKWLSMNIDYIARVQIKGKHSTAKALYKALYDQAGSGESPIQKGSDRDHGKLYFVNAFTAIGIGGFRNFWATVRNRAEILAN